MAVIVRNTFIEIQGPANPSSARRASSLPHMWRVRDLATSSIGVGAGTRLAVTNADDKTEAMQTNSRPTTNYLIPIAPTDLPTQTPDKTQMPAVPSSLCVERNNCAVRLNALDLFIPQTRTSRYARVTPTQVSPKTLIVHTTSGSSKLKARSRSASSDRSGCSGNSHSTGSTVSGSDRGSISSSTVSASVASPSSSGRNGVVATAEMPEEIECVSSSRRSRRRRAAARKGAEQVQLRVHAPLFQPAVSPSNQQASVLSNDMFEMVSDAQSAVLSCPYVLSVQIVKPVSHHTRATSVVVSFHPGKVWAHDVRTLAKNAFLEAAEKSEQVFILGYGIDPFSDESDAGFTATIGRVPVARQNAICWDFWQKGFCERLSTCRWCHPVSSDLMEVKFVFEPAQVPLQQVHPFWNGQECQMNSWYAPDNCIGCSA